MLLKYIIKNIFGQLKNSLSVYLIIIIFNIICFLLLFFLNGSELNYINYLRNEGDIIIRFNKIRNIEAIYNIVDKIIQNYSFNNMIQFFSHLVIGTKLIETNVLAFDQTDKIYQNFSISEGSFPDEKEILLPDLYKNSLKIGDTVKLRFMTNDNLLNTANLKISGFFKVTSYNKNTCIINKYSGSYLFGVDFNRLNIYFEKDYKQDDIFEINNYIMSEKKSGSDDFNYQMTGYRASLSEINKTTFIILRSFVYLIVLIVFILQLSFFINYNLSLIENDISDYFIFICLGAKTKKIIRLVLFKISFSFIFVVLLSFLLSILLIIPFNHIPVNLKDSIFLSPLFGGVNILSFNINFSIIFYFYLSYFIFFIFIHFIIIKNKIKKELAINVLKYSKNI